MGLDGLLDRRNARRAAQLVGLQRRHGDDLAHTRQLVLQVRLPVALDVVAQAGNDQAASTNDPLGTLDRVTQMAKEWGSEWVDVGAVGHINPASGFGEWPVAERLIQSLER